MVCASCGAASSYGGRRCAAWSAARRPPAADGDLAAGAYLGAALATVGLAAMQLAAGPAAFGAVNLAVGAILGLVAVRLLRPDRLGYMAGLGAAALASATAAALATIAENLLVPLIAACAV